MNILDVLDEFAEIQKDQKQTLNFKAPVFLKKQPSKSISKESESYNEHEQQKPIENSIESEISIKDQKEQNYNFSIQALVKNSMKMRPVQPDKQLFDMSVNKDHEPTENSYYGETENFNYEEEEEDKPDQNNLNNSYRNYEDDSMFKEHKRKSSNEFCQDEPLIYNSSYWNDNKKLKQSPRQQSTQQQPSTQMSRQSQAQNILSELQDNNQSFTRSQISVQSDKKLKISQLKQSNIKSKTRLITPNKKVKVQSPQKQEQKALIHVNIDLNGKLLVIPIHKDTMKQDIDTYLQGKVPSEKQSKLHEVIVQQIENYLNQLDNYLKTNDFQVIKQEKFKQMCKQNWNLLSEFNQNKNFLTPNKRSLSQITRDHFYNRDQSSKSLTKSSKNSMKSQSAKRLFDTSYYDFNESPFCSKHPKISKLMKDPPNISTSKEANSDPIQIKSTLVKNDFVTFELLLEGGRIGKITFNKNKINQEFNIQILHKKLIINKKLKQQDPKEITLTIEKFCIRHKLNSKQKTRIGKLLSLEKILQI